MTCYFNLLRIEASKDQWYGQVGGTNISPSWSVIGPYFWKGASNGMPICPKHGVYTIGKLTEVAKCSIGGPGHSIQHDTKPVIDNPLETPQSQTVK